MVHATAATLDLFVPTPTRSCESQRTIALWVGNKRAQTCDTCSKFQARIAVPYNKSTAQLGDIVSVPLAESSSNEGHERVETTASSSRNDAIPVLTKNQDQLGTLGAPGLLALCVGICSGVCGVDLWRPPLHL